MALQAHFEGKDAALRDVANTIRIALSSTMQNYKKLTVFPNISAVGDARISQGISPPQQCRSGHNIRQKPVKSPFDKIR